jgi:AcrR family transcriptional regulator
VDIRSERTRTLLFDAFEDLLEEKTFEAITVVDICKRSTVRRATFYRHFEEKYDFFDCYLKALTKRFMDSIEFASDTGDLLEYARNMHWALIMFFDEHPNLAKRSLGRTVLARNIDLIIKQIADGIVELAVRDCERENQTLSVSVDFIALFYSGGMMHTLRWWFLEDKPISASELVDSSMTYLERFFSK